MGQLGINIMTPVTILIIRTSAMGDVVMASPLSEGLRRTFPQARIVWLAEPQVASLLEHNPALDAVLVWPKARWKQLFRTRRLGALILEIRAFMVRLRAERVTLAIDAQALFRTRLLAWLSGARERIGFESREPGQFLMTRLVSKGGNTQEMGSEYFHLLQELGVEAATLRQSVQLAPESCKAAEKTLTSAGVVGEYAVFVPFTTRPQKHWFEQSWITLSRRVREELGMPVVWLGGPADHEAAESLATGGGGVNMAGKTGLSVSAAIIAKSSLLIGVDTGLTHLGTAYRVPTVALFGSTCPYTETRSPATVVLYHQLPCSPCRRRPTCDGRFECMQAITAEEVLSTARQLGLPRQQQ